MLMAVSVGEKGSGGDRSGGDDFFQGPGRMFGFDERVCFVGFD